MQETWVQFLGWEDSLEEEMATHSSNLAWKILWTEREAWWAAVQGVERDLDRTERLDHNQLSIYQALTAVPTSISCTRLTRFML